MYKYEEGANKRKRREQIEAIDRCYQWDELPNGPLIEIAQRLSDYDDLQAMYLVCSRWNSVLRESQCKFLDARLAGCCSRPHVPWLMMAEHDSVESDQLCLRPCSNKGKAMRLFIYSLSFQRVRELLIRLPPELELANFSDCFLYSSHRWVLVVRRKSTMCLYNPFCTPPDNYIPLPGSESLGGYVRRFSLSACPCTKTYMVMVIYAGNKIGLWKPGDKVWTLADRSIFSDAFLPAPLIRDVIFYRGYYYVLDELKNMHRFSSTDKLNWTRLNSLFDGMNDSSFRYLWKAYFVVISSPNKDEEKLLVVVREGLYPRTLPHFELGRDHLTAGFRVVELVVSPRRFDNRFKEVKSLGNNSLFVGLNQAFAVPVPKANGASGYYGCKPNCIYFTQDPLCPFTTAKCGKGKDVGVYNMEDGSIDRHLKGLLFQDHSPMLWVEPHS